MKNFYEKKIGVIVAIILVIVCSVSIIGVMKYKKNNSTEVLKQNNNESVKEKENKIKHVYIRYAFADVDLDQVIQDVDPKDEDTSGDYIFVRFTKVIDDKSDNSTLMNISNYKLDGKELPKDSKIYVDKKLKNSQIVIKLPDKFLKGKNSGHTLELNKNIKLNGSLKICGDLKINLPYSKKTTVDNEPDSQKSSLSNSKNSDVKNNITVKDNASTNSNDKTNKDNNSINNNNPINGTILSKESKDMPKYTVEIGKEVPFCTVVLVKFQDKDPSKYEVYVGDEKLKTKKNKEGKLVFVKGIKKDYSYDDVMDRIRIVKTK